MLPFFEQIRREAAERKAPVRLGVLCGSIVIIPEEAKERSLLDFTADAIPELRDMSAELQELERKLHVGVDDSDELDRLLARHGWLQSQIEHLGAYRLRVEAEQALSNLGFHESEFDRPLKSYSGGWRMRAALARTAQPT